MDNAHNHTVWVVEDDPYTLKICLRLLEKNGILCRGFGSAEEVLGAFEPGCAHTVLTDIHLPGKSGRELCTDLKQYDPAPRMIALDTAMERVSLLHAGFDDVLAKPFTEQTLLQVLGKTIEEESALRFPLLEQLIEDEEERNGILERFRTDTVRDLTLLEAALAENDPEAAGFFVHRLAGRLGQLDQRELDARFREIELQLGRNEPIVQLLPGLEKAVEDVRAFLQRMQRLSQKA